MVKASVNVKPTPMHFYSRIYNRCRVVVATHSKCGQIRTVKRVSGHEATC